MVAPGLDVPVAGLTAQEAARRLTTDGPNELQTERSRNLLQEAWDVICQPMIFVDDVCRHGRCDLDLSGAQDRAGTCRAAGSVLAEGAGDPRWGPGAHRGSRRGAWRCIGNLRI